MDGFSTRVVEAGVSIWLGFLAAIANSTFPPAVWVCPIAQRGEATEQTDCGQSGITEPSKCPPGLYGQGSWAEAPRLPGHTKAPLSDEL